MNFSLTDYLRGLSPGRGNSCRGSRLFISRRREVSQGLDGWRNERRDGWMGVRLDFWISGLLD